MRLAARRAVGLAIRAASLYPAVFYDSQTTDIGHPKLFIGGAVDHRECAAAPTVNNFVALQTAMGLG